MRAGEQIFSSRAAYLSCPGVRQYRIFIFLFVYLPNNPAGYDKIRVAFPFPNSIPFLAFLFSSLSHLSNPATAGPKKKKMASSATSSQKPAIIIVHGAWSLPSPSYEPLKHQLEGLGYECYLPHLKTSGGDEVRGQTWEADVQVILDTAQPLFDRGREVVIVAHSYGGIPGGAATAGNGVAERAREGKKGGFRQIIYVAAFAIPVTNTDLLATFGGQWPPWADFAPAYLKVSSYEATFEPLVHVSFRIPDPAHACSAMVELCADGLHVAVSFP